MNNDIFIKFNTSIFSMNNLPMQNNERRDQSFDYKSDFIFCVLLKKRLAVLQLARSSSYSLV